MNATQRKRLLRLAAALAKVSQELTDLHAVICGDRRSLGKTKKVESTHTCVGYYIRTK